MSQYGEIFRGGIYNNGQTGVVDVFGINYYPRAQSWRILEQVEKKRPPDYQILMQWLQKVKHYIGFYILGE